MEKLSNFKEEQRLKALKEYNLKDITLDFSYIIDSLAKICDVPLCSIVVVYEEELFVVASTGVAMDGSFKRAGSCTQHTIHKNRFCEIEDIKLVENIDDKSYLFDDFKIRFYAGHPLTDPGGNTLGVLNVYDIKPRTLTDEQKSFLSRAAKRIVQLFIQKREEQQLRHFDNIFYRSKDIIGIVHLSGKIIKVNPSFLQITGYSEDEVMKRNLKDFFPVDSYPRGKDIRERYKSENPYTSYVIQLKTADNKLRTVEWTGIMEKNTELVYFIGRDVTDQQKQAELLRRNEERFRAFFENSLSLMCTHDMQGNFTSINKSGANMLGCSVEEALQMNVKDFYLKDHDSFLLSYLANLGRQKNISSVVEAKRKDGEKRHWFINAVIEENVDGEDYVIGNAVDITDRYKMEEALKLATKKAKRANQAKSDFIASMSHEIRTPLNGIIGFTDLMLKTEMDDTQGQYLKIINQSATTLHNIVNQILDFSKIESQKITLVKEKIDLQTLASDAFAMISFASEKKRLEMLLDFQEGLPRFIWADEVRLKQVLVNLLSNAVKFTEKGEVKLSISLKEKLQNNYIKLRFQVCDTGVGIHPSKLGEIFKAFTQEDGSITKRYGGTGLGLTISNRLLQLMGSKLDVKSELGIGSCFSFELKLKAEKGTFDDELLKDIKRVLVVDDNDSNRQILKRMLQLKKIEVDEADSGLSALLMLQKNAEYDVIIMDYHMPLMDGIETIRKIKGDIIKTDKLEEQPIVMLYSSSDSEQLQAECDSLDIQSRLVKPIKMREMYEVLAQLKNDKLEKIKSNEAVVGDNKVSALQDEPFTILIAEDNEVNMYLAKVLVKELTPSSTIIEAKDGEEAVELFFDKAPDLVLMDIQMPKMNGYQATQAIRQKETGNKTPIIALTAGNMMGEKEKCLAAGMNEFMAKPIVKKDLGKLLERWLKTTKANKHENSHKHDNIEQLNKTLLHYCATEDSEFRAQFIKLALSEIEKSANELQKAMREKDLKALNAAGHKLKGTSLAVGLPELSKLAVAFELLTQFEEEYLRSLLESILFEIRTVSDFLKSEE